MTTLLLPADEIAKLRVMKGLAYMLAVMITLDRHYPGHAFRPEQIAMVAGMDVRTASKQLQDLSTLDRVILSKGGYVLTQGGRALFLAPANDEALALSPEGIQALEAQALTQSITSIPAFLQIGKASDLGEGESNTHTVCALEEVEESSLILRIKDSSSSTKSTQTVLTTKIILAHSSILFGEPGVVMARLDLDAIPVHYALGWMAQAYDQRRRSDYPRGLESPAGLVYSRLRDIEKPKPREQYYIAPEKYLPDEYLEALGLVHYECCSCHMKFAMRAELEKHESLMFICEHGCDVHFHTMDEVEKHLDSEHTSAPVEAVEMLNADSDGARAWTQVKALLQVELPRANFETWVRDTQPVSYDGQLLTVGAKNVYCRDWLESRLESTVERMLIGILNAQVKVRFVVANVGGESGDE
jgi:hypothetical protein